MTEWLVLIIERMNSQNKLIFLVLRIKYLLDEWISIIDLKIKMLSAIKPDAREALA